MTPDDWNSLRQAFESYDVWESRKPAVSVEKLGLETVRQILSGTGEPLSLGRNGVFHDRKGGEWGAAIVKIIEHPIRIIEAFWSPYRPLGRMISEQVEKLASSGDKSIQSNLSSGVADAGKAVAASAPVAAPPFDAGRFAGIFAAIGLAIGAIGTAIASVVTGFLGLPWWRMPMALVGVLLVIPGPSMVMVWLRLGKRNLGPLLDRFPFRRRNLRRSFPLSNVSYMTNSTEGASVAAESESI